MADQFSTFATGLDSPGSVAIAVTPHDSNNLTNTTRALYIGTAGDISVEMAGSGSAIVFKSAFGLLPIRVTRVNATLTTATNIVAVS